jgi:hypothetical protein
MVVLPTVSANVPDSLDTNLFQKSEVLKSELDLARFWP